MRTEAWLATWVATLAVVAGCGGDGESCGPPLVDGSIAVDLGVAEIAFVDFTSSANNDCTSGSVTSLTVEGHQEDDPGKLVIFCLPAPDRIGDSPIDLSDVESIQVIDVFASTAGCTASIDRAATASGEARFTGLCDSGVDPAGYGLAIDGTLPIQLTCGDAIQMIAAPSSGSVAVVAD